jgi:hypothetical protein
MDWIESMLSAMVSLRVFKIDFGLITAEAIPLIKNNSSHLQYFTVYNRRALDRCWKQLHGEWIFCDDTECPKQHQGREDMCIQFVKKWVCG